MKYTLAVLALAVAIFAPARAQKNEPAQVTDATEQALIDLENKWVDALVKADTAALDTIFADSYVDSDEHGHRGDKQAVLAVLKSGELKMTSIKLSDMTAHVYGDAAVVTGSAAQTGTFNGQLINATIIFTDTFVRQNGRWRAVASHRSTL